MAEEFEKLCDALISESGGEENCKRFQERIELGNGGILARLHVHPYLDVDHEDDDFGHKVIIRDVSRSGIGLLCHDELTLDSLCMLHVVNLTPVQGTLIYRKEEADGQHRYGFSLDEWLSEENHQRLSV
ncbi:PilZ domain-containing protein [Enterovibrio norvegicus]|uniref:Uncharacterized protein n=1 Tax=Enterovibrio norvegicus TaxID=188144 RepID=A0A2N7LBU6_9GAMM|nr:PilZ domain-containing protein [Enterovibrio norvegicus]PML78382.1 hypothetical protein BCT69_16240 [Enterovibrio norvegicus]PMN72483.1 hypothetical protein BCT27_13850 [Enterovibrio norvegicus]PMN92722.1 hypothetical protein BCT23_14700 [Enterovibrio norvegicus]